MWFNNHQMSPQVGAGPEVNKFEQVSSDDHQMSLVGSLYSEVPCLEGAETRDGGKGSHVQWGPISVIIMAHNDDHLRKQQI